MTDATWCAVEQTPQMRGVMTGICSAGVPLDEVLEAAHFNRLELGGLHFAVVNDHFHPGVTFNPAEGESKSSLPLEHLLFRTGRTAGIHIIGELEEEQGKLR